MLRRSSCRDCLLRTPVSEKPVMRVDAFAFANDRYSILFSRGRFIFSLLASWYCVSAALK
jgi:hypothetical protein